MMGRRLFLATALICVAMAAAQAQNFPDKPIKLIVPFTPGSPNDVLARVVTQPMAEKLGQPVVIEHKPGAGTTIGMRAVAFAEPDGHTLLFTASNHGISAALYKNLDFDPVKSYAPVGLVASSPWILVVAPSVPVKTVKEMVDYSKANPGTLNFGFGQGTAPQLIGESLRTMAGADIASIPYKGGAQAVADILGGTVHMNVGTPATLMPLIQQGKLRPLAVTGETRIPDLPDVPTMREIGWPQLGLTYTAGILAPAKTPPAVIAKLNAALNASLQSEDVRKSLAKLDFTARPVSPQDYASFIAVEMDNWATVVKASGAKLN